MSGSLGGYRAAVTRYRAMAYVVGVCLLVLVLIAMPLKYVAGQPLLVAVVGPIHGFLYIVYLLTAFDLAIRSRWSPVATVLVLLAGTIPFVAFVAERRVVRSMVRPAGQPAASGRPAVTPADSTDPDRPPVPRWSER